ncbi:unnamed protein product [Phytophthora fragariaefolia]|uniref:Unnamed protein product n=1 Tax=Phytophthora fragariaefolia TaxID=1490495 RepID=A0A9W6Y1M4_9STRA|nr:unnamed protein product [Phytophthora fragariaefolia]
MRLTAVCWIAFHAVSVTGKTQDERSQPLLRELMSMDEQNQSLSMHPRLLLAQSSDSCSWGSGLKCTLTQQINNLKLGDTCVLPVPVPTDNYVGDKRRNKNDDSLMTTASDNPFIEITSTRRGGTKDSTDQAAWYQYVKNPLSVQSSITFNVPGAYDLSISASDYDKVASCAGCVAITDEYRPRFDQGSCPTYTYSIPPVTYDSLTKIRNHEILYDAYVASTNILNNADSGEDCSDVISKVEYLRDDLKDFTGSCFDDAALATNLANLKASPFTTYLQTHTTTLQSTLYGNCQWCCRKIKTLKEKYTAFGCGTLSPTTTCLGGSTKKYCALDRCLMLPASSLASKSISIKSTVQTKSGNVLNDLPSKPQGSDVAKNVYYSIPCTNYNDMDTQCHYIAKLSELVDTSTDFVSSFPLPADETNNINAYVFWRYNLNGNSWVMWDPASDDDISFTKSSTTVTIEAWTGCGRIGNAFAFDVKLYPHSTLTCTKFKAMWSPVGSTTDGGGAYCAYSGSDFAIINAKITTSDIIPLVAETVAGSYVGFKCQIMVKEDGAVDTTPYDLLDESIAVVDKNFAVELVRNPHTAQKTAVSVTCTFTRTARSNTVMLADDTDPHSITCSRDFTLTDCDKPQLHTSDEVEVCENRCAGNSLQGPNEACGGMVVTSSAIATTVSTTARSCCTSCIADLECTDIGSTTIQRCEAEQVTWIPNSGDDGDILLATLTAAKASVLANDSTPTLVGLSAIVVVLVLFVAKRRAEMENVNEDQNAYYSLLQ